MPHLHELRFNNDFVSAFPGDQSGNLTPRQTPGVLYSLALPTPVNAPRLLAWSAELAAELGLESPDEKDIALLGGNLVTATMKPYAACYGGHQFGYWAGQLGDGRAITLGEINDADGKIRELQLKGGGPTAYSRHADGRAVLRSSLREYLMSEAMHYLGVPTTRALGLVATGDQVLRDMFYDGHAAYEPGAIVLRVAPSFLRFGNFELPAARNELDNLRQLIDWTIERLYPHITGEDRVIRWFSEIVERTAALVIEWIRVGFVHGVMNTDNMSILGLTIDYGPFSFLDAYDPDFTPNTTDLPGRRYAFGRQATIAQWNLGCLASALGPLFKGTDELVTALKGFETLFWNKYYPMKAAKLGLGKPRPGDEELIDRFEQMLSTLKPDMTIFHQLLIDLPPGRQDTEDLLRHFADSFYVQPGTDQAEQLRDVIHSYQQRRSEAGVNESDRRAIMEAANPGFVLRNYLLHQAIEELERGATGLFERLQLAIREPYSRASDEFFVRRPDWAAQQAGCSMLSCSS